MVAASPPHPMRGFNLLGDESSPLITCSAVPTCEGLSSAIHPTLIVSTCEGELSLEPDPEYFTELLQPTRDIDLPRKPNDTPQISSIVTTFEGDLDPSHTTRLTFEVIVSLFQSTGPCGPSYRWSANCGAQPRISTCEEVCDT